MSSLQATRLTVGRNLHGAWGNCLKALIMLIPLIIWTLVATLIRVFWYTAKLNLSIPISATIGPFMWEAQEGAMLQSKFLYG